MRSRWVVLTIALTLLAAACGDGDGGVQPPVGDGTPAEGGGEFSVYVCEPESLTPTNTNETCGAEVLNALFTGLIDYDPQTSQPVNAMAESIDVSDDGLTYTIQIQDGWTFHDGSPVTAQSFADAWNFGAYQPNAQGNSHFFDKIEGYEDLQCPEELLDEEGNCTGEPSAREMSGLQVVDDTTLEVTLSQPFSQFPLTLGYTAFYPMPESAFEDIDAYNEAPVGNGPFQMDGSWEHDQAVNVVRYEDYAGDNPAKADALEFRIYSEINTAYNDLLAGNLDIMDSLPPEQIEAAKTEFGDRYIEGESSSFTYLGFPLYDAKFQNRELRQAFSMAIDREAITTAILPDRTPAASFVSPVVAGARENPCGENCSYDPEAASAKLEAAGGWQGTLTLWFNSGAGHEEWMNAVANQLRQNLGIADIQFETLEFAQYLTRLDAREITGPFRLGWVMDYPSPQNYLEPIHGSNGSSNNTGFSNAEFDQLIADGNAADSIEEGIEDYQAAEDILVDEMPIIPLFFGRVSAAHSDRVSNVVIDAFTRINTANVEVTG